MPIQNDELIQNEIELRDKNVAAKDGIKKYFRNDKSVQETPITFDCECSDLDCNKHVKTSIKTYEQIHKRDDRFAVAKGHETPAVEKIVAKHTKFDVVEKPALNA